MLAAVGSGTCLLIGVGSALAVLGWLALLSILAARRSLRFLRLDGLASVVS